MTAFAARPAHRTPQMSLRRRAGVAFQIHERRFSLLLCVCWMLSLACLSAPGRGGGAMTTSLEPIIVAKAVVRAVSLIVLSLLIVRCSANVRMRHVVSRLLPFLIFSAWALASCIWSPIKLVSLGHATECLMLVMLAVTTGTLCVEERHIERILFHFTAIMMVVLCLLMALNYQPILHNLRPTAYMHPNNMAAIAGIGLLLLTTCRIVWNWRWTRALLVPGLLTFTATMYVSRSRSAIVVTSAVLFVSFVYFRKAFIWLTVVGILGAGIALFPYVDSISDLPDTFWSYIMRGQSVEEAYTISGRTELWELAIQSFKESPIFGHGYYNMSSSGSVRVWGMERWQTAHNVLLHLLTGAGLIGSFLFLWALCFVFSPIRRCLRANLRLRRLAILIAITIAWYFALGSFELSFLGPTDPQVVLFFVIAGVAAGCLQPRPAMATCGARSPASRVRDAVWTPVDSCTPTMGRAT